MTTTPSNKHAPNPDQFKMYTHERLDAMGVPPEGMGPDNEHFKAGCRIGSRLDWVEARLKAYEALCRMR